MIHSLLWILFKLIRMQAYILNMFWLLYQYHGGTNFGRTTGGPFIATSYDYDAPIDECGMIFSLYQ